LESGGIMSTDNCTIEFTLRRADTDHATLVTRLIEEFCQLDHHEFDPTRVQQALGPLLASDKFGVVNLIEQPTDTAPPANPCVDNALGYSIVTWGYSIESGGREGLIDEFYLRRQGTGLGSRVFPELLRALATYQLKVIFLETERPNAAARRFYQRQGFVEDDSIWMSKMVITGN
jgi:GNAT superfamily N-acetyltransferase